MIKVVCVENVDSKELCKLTLSKDDQVRLRDAIEDLYYFEFVIGQCHAAHCVMYCAYVLSAHIFVSSVYVNSMFVNWASIDCSDKLMSAQNHMISDDLH